MEQDIKIIKSVIYNQNSKQMNYIDIDNITPDEECKTFITAIEHLIKAYKELEKELNSVKEIYYTQKEIEENYTPVSLVEEKIEELKEKRDDYLYKLQVYGDFRINEPNYSDLILQINFKIQVLQELLEKRK